MLVSGEDLLSLIPQRPPIVMIDTLYFCTEQETKTGFTITKDNIFFEDNQFSEAGLMENIAQTAAAHAGFLSRKANREAPVGFIGAVKNLEIFSFPKEGDTLVTTVIIEQEVFGVTLISGNIVCNEQMIAKAEMKIIIQR
jgi:predicted hotdog family 3-hydroxylacyl-ACP dehydratase